ncbi:hypothetical protein QC764_0023210 [Podospora pseudoanserina]|uniref:Uncharacterized protein n=1 Tax=Podospora pseudoanserina TaxID=2609844 RepID=A0ABR0IRL6_9PEZI|nr:hypothetical protein QC764_0023210 [Podospora pseudoanserina]
MGWSRRKNMFPFGPSLLRLTQGQDARWQAVRQSAHDLVIHPACLHCLRPQQVPRKLLPQVTNQTGDVLASFLEIVAIALGQFSDISRSVPAFRRQVKHGLDNGLNFDLTILVTASFINTGSSIFSGGCLSTGGFFLVVALKSTRGQGTCSSRPIVPPSPLLATQ